MEIPLTILIITAFAFLAPTEYTSYLASGITTLITVELGMKTMGYTVDTAGRTRKNGKYVKKRDYRIMKTLLTLATLPAVSATAQLLQNTITETVMQMNPATRITTTLLIMLTVALYVYTQET